MTVLNKKMSIMTLAILCMAGVLLGSSVATALVVSSPVWSNVVSHQFTSQAWVGTVAVSFPSASSNVGDSVTLTATLNPIPSQYQLQQNVTFYYSTTPIAIDGSGNPTNLNQLSLVGPDQSSSTILTTSGITHLTFTPQVSGTFYFIAEVVTPT
jgi:hypothetical protein